MSSAPSVPSAPVTLTARQRARIAVTGEIVAAARRQLAEQGAAGISLRAVARDLRMPSSGIYRYFATRDDLLTHLIIEAYDALGAAVEASQEGIRVDDGARRMAAAFRAARRWALAHPHEYALVFGTPVPGYVAPERTVDAAVRIPAVLSDILRRASGERSDAGDGPALSRKGKAAIAPAVAFTGGAVAPGRLQGGLMVWSALFGAISFEVFNHWVGTVDDTPEAHDAFFEECIRRWLDQLGLS